jgi:FixJ family two-component response regulator
MTSIFSAVIAVVDDEASVRKAFLRLFRAAGVEARIFSSAREFLDSLPSYRYDCVVLDLHMPGLSGFDVLLDSGFIDAHLPVVIVSADDDPDVRKKCIEAGVSVYLCKPVDYKKLFDGIGTAMDKTFPY